MKQNKKFNVFVWEFNSSSPEAYDIIAPLANEWKSKKGKKSAYWGYDSKTKANLSQPSTMKELEAWVDREAQYRWWAKCEYEMIVSPWPPKEDTDKKVDVYSQVKANLSLITEVLAEAINFKEISK